MPDYKETTVQGRSWQRCNQITFRNPVQGAPSASFDEEVVTTLADRVIVEPMRMMASAMPGGIHTIYKPEATFPLLNPETGEPTGKQMSQQDIYVALYSLYMQQAAKRDEAEAAHQANMQAQHDAAQQPPQPAQPEQPVSP